MQEQIIKEMNVKSSIDVLEEITNRVNYIKDFLITTNKKALVLGISGGQDSTLAGKLCSMAVTELGSEYSFHAIRLPYGIQNDESDCVDAINFIKPTKTHIVNIKDSVDSLVNSIDTGISDFNKGNIKARARMTAQYAIAGSVDALVVGTDHSSEAVTGFFTKFGDGGFDFTPLFGLNKRQGRMLLKYLDAPSHLYTKTPTADLEENKPQLSDEVALGFSYDELDDYLEGKEVSHETKLKIESRYKASAHKRVTPYAYGK